MTNPVSGSNGDCFGRRAVSRDNVGMNSLLQICFLSPVYKHADLPILLPCKEILFTVTPPSWQTL